MIDLSLKWVDFFIHWHCHNDVTVGLQKWMPRIIAGCTVQIQGGPKK